MGYPATRGARSVAVTFAAQSDPSAQAPSMYGLATKGRTESRSPSCSDFERHRKGWESMRDYVADQQQWPGIMEAYARFGGSLD
jgi:hypothetical protein